MSVIFPGDAMNVHLDDGIVEVRLQREPCNEIGTTALAELERLVEFTADHRADIQAMVIHIAVKAGFCAGADLRELHAAIEERWAPLRRVSHRVGGLRHAELIPNGARRWARRGARRAMTPILVRQVRSFLQRIHAAFDALDRAPFTTVAAIHGVCFGGGLELALTADVIVADRTARFAFPELRLGIVPGFGGIPRLERDVGNAVVRDLLLTGRSLGAKRAHAVGLVAQVVGRGEALTAARAVARQATRFDPGTVARAKAFIKPIPRQRLDLEIQTFCEMFTSGVMHEALTEFVESTDARPYLP